MKTLSLLLVGLVVVSNLASCGCDDKKEPKEFEIKQGDKKKIKFTAKKEITEAQTKLVEIKVEKDGILEQHGKTLHASGVTTAIANGAEFEVELQVKKDAPKGSYKVQIVLTTDKNDVFAESKESVTVLEADKK